MAFKMNNPLKQSLRDKLRMAKNPGQVQTEQHNKMRDQALLDSERDYKQAKYDFEADPRVQAKKAGFTMKGFTYPGNAFKQEGPIDRKNPKRKPSELEGTWIYGRGYDEEDTAGERGAGFDPGKGKDEKFTAIERINDIEERISFIKEDISNQDGGATKQQKKDLKELKQELAIMRKRYKNETKKKK